MKKNKKPASSVKTSKAKSTCCKTCGRKPSRKQKKLTQEVIDTRRIAIVIMGVLLLVTVFLMQSKYWIHALPLLALYCLPKTVLWVLSTTYFVRCNISALISFLREAFKWLLPLSTSLSLATLLTPTGESILFVGIFSFAYAGLLLVGLISDLCELNPTAR